jgi:hypothetical protein
MSTLTSDVMAILGIIEANEDPAVVANLTDELVRPWPLVRQEAAIQEARRITAEAKAAKWMGSLTDWLEQHSAGSSRLQGLNFLGAKEISVNEQGQVVGELVGQSSFARRTLKGYTSTPQSEAAFKEAKGEAGIDDDTVESVTVSPIAGGKITELPSIGELPRDQELMASQIIGHLGPHPGSRLTQEKLNAKVAEILKGLPTEDAKKVLRRVQTMLNERERQQKKDLANLRKVKGQAEEVEKVAGARESATPLMARFFDEFANGAVDVMTESLNNVARGGPSWENNLSDILAEQLEGKATFEGRPATADEIRRSMYGADQMLRALTLQQRAVYRLVITTAAGQVGTGKELNIDINRYIKIAIWSEEAAKRYWCDLAWKDTNGSAQVHEARMTLLARLLKEINDRPDLELTFSFAAFVIMVWWEADEKPANRAAEETVHAVLQAGAETGASPWTGPTLLWLQDWHQSAFARINVGHKLAAALALTDVPADVPHSPWKAWSMVIPDGMFTPTDTTAGWDLVAHNRQQRISKPFKEVMEESVVRNWTGVVLRRAWFRGTELVGIVADWDFDPGVAGEDPLQCAAVSIGASMVDAVGPDLIAMVRSLGLGVLAAITNQPARRSGSWGLTRRRPGSKKPEKLSMGEIWDVASPVTIDLREHVRNIQTGKTRAQRSAPTAAWIVRGHWKMQAHGAGRALRKRIWIEPFWKGEESMRKLMRGVEVKE